MGPNGAVADRRVTPHLTSPLDRLPGDDYLRFDYANPAAYFRDLVGISWTPDFLLAGPTASAPWTAVDVRVPVHLNRLVLVPVARPSYVPMALQWGVPNDDLSPHAFATCLRSWEERFGAVLTWMVTISQAEIELTAPPTDRLNARRLAVEVIAFARDSWGQSGLKGDFAGPAVEEAERLGRSTRWQLWWD